MCVLSIGEPMKIDQISVCVATEGVSTEFPAIIGHVPAGFPSPSQDYSSTHIDLTELLIRDQISTFIVRVSGSSMEGAGISHGDELIVDKGLEPQDGDVVIAAMDGEMTVKRLCITPQGIILKAENPEYPDITVPELSELTVWGVATTCLHALRNRGFSGTRESRRRQ